MLIGDLHCSTVIGWGGEFNQSEWGMEDMEGVEAQRVQSTEDTEGAEVCRLS